MIRGVALLREAVTMYEAEEPGGGLEVLTARVLFVPPY